jgi:S-methylmethionine-dependent homocysteine/selenocysteine methylase
MDCAADPDDTRLPMTLEQWDLAVGHHLEFIEAGAEMAARHSRQLLARPDWETLAEAELAKVEKVLENALQQVRAARASYGSKDIAR